MLRLQEGYNKLSPDPVSGVSQIIMHTIVPAAFGMGTLGRDTRTETAG